MLKFLSSLFGREAPPQSVSNPRVQAPLSVEVTFSNSSGVPPPEIDIGPLTESPDGWILNPKSNFAITISGISRAQAAELKSLLDRPGMSYYEGRKQLAQSIARWNLRWRELDQYVSEFKRKYLANIEEQKKATPDWDSASDLDREDMLEAFRKAAVESLDVRPFAGLDVLFENELTDATVDDALLDRYGFDLLQVYFGRARNLDKVHRVDAQAYERKAFEDLATKGLAVRGADVPLEHVLASLTLKELNAVAEPVPKPFGRKAKAIEWLLQQTDLRERVGKIVAFREVFQLRPLPQEFAAINLATVSASWRRAAEIGGLLAHTYAFGMSAAQAVKNKSGFASGWEVLATEDSCPACKRAAAKKYATSRPPKVPVHIGCRCCLVFRIQ